MDGDKNMQCIVHIFLMFWKGLKDIGILTRLTHALGRHICHFGCFYNWWNTGRLRHYYCYCQIWFWQGANDMIALVLFQALFLVAWWLVINLQPRTLPTRQLLPTFHWFIVRHFPSHGKKKFLLEIFNFQFDETSTKLERTRFQLMRIRTSNLLENYR